LQDDEEADEETVSPLLPLLTKTHADISRNTFLLLHDGQSGFSDPKTRYSKSLLQFSQ